MVLAKQALDGTRCCALAPFWELRDTGCISETQLSRRLYSAGSNKAKKISGCFCLS